MVKEKSSTTVLNVPHRSLQSPDAVTIERLVSTSDYKQILDFLRHITKHPANHALDGFSTPRAQEHNWRFIAKKLVNLAVKDRKVLGFIIDMWMKKNRELFEKIVREKIDNDVEKTVIQFLIEIGDDDNIWVRVWCVLLLDISESTQQVLNNGLGDALLDENSSLRLRVELAKQGKAREQYQQQIRSLQDEVDSWKQRYEQEVEERQQEHNTYEVDHEQQTKIIAELGNTITDLEVEKTKIQQDLIQMQSLYEQEQGKTNSLQSEVGRLKQKLAEGHQKSDEVRTENAQLKSNEKRLTERGKIIETERDAEVQKRRELQKQLEAANREKEIQERLKQTAINKYHQLQAAMEQQATEIAKYISLSPSQLDVAWQQSLTILSQHFSSSLGQSQRERRIVPNEEKLADWQDWQEEEEKLVHTLFSSPQLEHATYLIQVRKAQKLLLVRWYLLEWLRSTISQVVRVNDDHDRQD